MAAGSPITMRHAAQNRTADVPGPVAQGAAVDDADEYSAPTPAGAVAVKSAAQTDLDTAAAQIEALTTTLNDLLASLRAAGVIAAS